jgi:hypothetical protein
LSLDNDTNWLVCQHGQANIERRSGVEEGAFFHHFASKEAYAIAAAEHPAPLGRWPNPPYRLA